MTEEQRKYYNAMKKLGSKKPQKPVPRPEVRWYLKSSRGEIIFAKLKIWYPSSDYIYKDKDVDEVTTLVRLHNDVIILLKIIYLVQVASN